ncbi:Smr/MutS family protein [Cupriavidus consociatus]|uniref:Smr/MutS family protein n=1 Tax=Cupriavidus consociatus TaxID=2821357 RepID=UPI001AE97012|nr:MULTISPECIES: Smr/MutS family protein [unclassified Cupriavidus]MBP0622251.1 Smr/MutS family protein [Cupriavidus sp. LEh25]MDK2658928.1 Smr/MutS family protein [Cupriavidus sp. LEh21]
MTQGARKPDRPTQRFGLNDLSRLRDNLKADAERREAERLAAEQAAQRAREEADVFRASVGQVSQLRARNRAHHPASKPAPVPVQSQRNDQAVLQASLSDEFDVESLLETDETLSFRRPGIGMDVIRKLRRGEWVPQDKVDLHGLRSDEAREALAEFLRRSVRNGVRCVRVIHGKGLGSPDKLPVLKGKVRSWLVQKEEVLAFVQAREAEGGAGALMVLLRQPKP